MVKPNQTDNAPATILKAAEIVKVYPNGVAANRGIDIEVRSGEIYAIVGENGAGKSTLMKILYGLEEPTSGQIFLHGEPVSIESPEKAIDLGIGMVHQNFMLVDSFTVAENITLGRETMKGAVLDRQRGIEDTRALSALYGLDVNPDARVELIPVGMRQRVEILKALYRGAEILILDEPTAVLTPKETQDLFAAIRNLVKEGKTLIFITHKLREVMEISDRVMVMRDGRKVGTVNTHETSIPELARMMVGREVFMQVNKPPVTRGAPVLKVRNLLYANEAGRPLVNHVSFSVHAFEILGIAGVEGNGQTELVEVLTGLRPMTAGEAEIDGRSLLGHGPRGVREAGVAHIPEDRLTNGVARLGSIADNLIVDRYYRPPFTRRLLLDNRMIRQNAAELIKRFGILAPNGELPVNSLSGGNMQKVIVAREFSSSPRLLVAAQPTRGVDIGAIEFIHQQLIDKRTEGLAILLVSADLQEVMKLADRIMVMYNGEIVAMFPNTPDLTEEELGLYMLGVRRQSIEELEAV
ncbi:MAG: ABC transporter ATP-binding protein [Anaerolineae bacterium]|nr:ABC transporter ATP-binding protein [Anaerolineae bacterium]